MVSAGADRPGGGHAGCDDGLYDDFGLRMLFEDVVAGEETAAEW